MQLKQLIKNIGLTDFAKENIDFEVKGISCNSKAMEKDFIFVAIQGTHEDGHEFIQEAIERGAKAVIVQCQAPAYWQGSVKCQDRINFIQVADTRITLAKLAAEFYGNPSQKIKTIGITGTNGKTTVSYLLEALLKEYGRTPAVIGTINYRFKDKILPSKNTTPGPLEIQSMLAQMQKEGVDYAIMEVSSHALHQDRVEGINFESAIFTNLTQDHLDYHKTIENYFQAKSKLFKNMQPEVFAVLNNDDAYSRRLKEITKAQIITYGIEQNSDVTAKDIKCDLSSTEFVLKAHHQEINIKTRLIGRHNVYNILCTAAWASKEGIAVSVLKSAIDKFRSVPGRLERITRDSDFLVFVDYAHTEDALNKVLGTLRPLSKNRIIVVFGCGGERDKTKRPKMGYAVTEQADFAIITNDNPRSEDPQEIISDIKEGIKKDNYCVIADRDEAIKKALSLAKAGDIVLIAGKGHETYQVLKDRTIHFDDREVVRECFKSRSY